MSISKWEKSFFGGHKKVLWDYPEIKVPYEINIELPPFKGNPKMEDLGYFAAMKLMKLYLLKVKEFNLIPQLLAGKNVIGTKKTSFSFIRKEKVLYIDPARIQHVLSAIIFAEAELKEMFIEYADFIKQVSLSMDIPDEKEGNSSSGKGKKGDGDKDGDESSGKDIRKLESTLEVKLLKVEFNTKKEWVYSCGSVTNGTLTKNTKFLTLKKRKSTRYSSEEKIASLNLVKKLDISFDPQKDIIKNIKMGKLDVAKLANSITGDSNLYYKIEDNQTTKPFSVCILGDESGSMSYADIIGEQKSLIKVLYAAFRQILPPDKIYVYGHTGYHTPDIMIYNDKFNDTFDETIDNMGANKMEQNYDGPVIESIFNKIRTFTDDNILMISISDGEPSGHSYGGPPAIVEMKKIIEKCKREGFVTVGIGIKHNVEEIYNYHTRVDNIEDLVKKSVLIINKAVKAEFQ